MIRIVCANNLKGGDQFKQFFMIFISDKDERKVIREVIKEVFINAFS